MYTTFHYQYQQYQYTVTGPFYPLGSLPPGWEIWGWSALAGGLRWLCN